MYAGVPPTFSSLMCWSLAPIAGISTLIATTVICCDSTLTLSWFLKTPRPRAAAIVISCVCQFVIWPSRLALMLRTIFRSVL